MRRRLLSEERGAVLVMAAVMIPVFLLLTALVVDVGNWFTHKRQLQNRADAAAFAAGVGYAQNWKACVQTGDAALRLATARAIADVAREYAGNPEASDYTSGTLPAALRNTEIANQANLDVVINSNDPDYTDDTDFTDGGAGVPPPGDPCFLHAADDLSAAGHWTDVRVKERDLPSIFGNVGLPLNRNGARARVEIRPATSGNRFLPLAVPNNVITKVQVRYYDECRDPSHTGTPLLKEDLATLPSGPNGYQIPGVGTLWGIANGGVGDPNTGRTVTLPSYDPSCGAYLPIGVQVRIASRDEISFETNTCAQLLAMQYADCFSRLSQIRIWNDGLGNEIRIGDVRVTGGCNISGDHYFDTLPVAATDCRFGADVWVNWGDRDDGILGDFPDNYTVTVNGQTAIPPGSLNKTGPNLYSVPANAIIGNPGANDLTVSANWEDNNTSHTYGGAACKNGNNPCEDSLTEPVHRTFVGTQGTAGAVAFVHTADTAWSSPTNPIPGSSPETLPTGGNTVTLFPTVGIRTVLRAGVLTTLRLDDPQANQTLRCDPDVAQGQEFEVFRFGCKPWYGENDFTGVPNENTTGSWWNTSTKTCPPDGQWFSYADQGAGFGENSRNNPWRCVLTAPGLSTGQIGDDIAVATKNCDNINNNSCQTFDCNYHGNYDGKPGYPNGWLADGGLSGAVPPNPALLGSKNPRVVNLFIVPYQSSKGLTGAGDEIPVLGFASFYVMNWTGANTNQSDPCPDRTFGSINVPDPPKGAITGVFVETVKYEPGPVDETKVCVEGQLTPCRVTLVR